MWRSAACVALAASLGACGDDIPTEDPGAGSEDAGDTAAADSGGTEDGEDETGGIVPVDFCEGEVELVYDPLAGGLDAFPDDFFTADEDTPTGLRVDLRLGENVILSDTATAFDRVFSAASTLDGFGTTAGLYVQFSDEIDESTMPPGDDPSPDDNVLLLDLSQDPPQLVPFSWRTVPEDPGLTRTTLSLEPLRPLRPMAPHVLAIKSELQTAQGDCTAPSATMMELLTGQTADPSLDRMVGRYEDAVDALKAIDAVGLPQELAGVVTFTTQHTVEDSVAIAEVIAGEDYAYAPGPDPCEDPTEDGSADFLQCDGSVELDDFTEDGVVSEAHASQGRYELPLTIYVPKDTPPPWPTLIYGHGLGGDRFQAEALAEFAAPVGLAVVTLPAPSHGEHPDSTDFQDVLDFFGLSLDLTDPLDALVLRDNFRQGTYDKLQVLQMVLGGVDVDDDGETDLDPESVHYLGVSLGGIMGSEFVAFAPQLGTATLIVPGARVTSIVKEGAQFELVINIFAGMATDGEIERFFPLVQAVIDRGDAGVYAPHVIDARLPGFDQSGPQVLMEMVIDDDTVPNSTNGYLARGLGVPHVGEVLLDVGLEAVQAPLSGNLDGVTAGMFQFDVIDVDGGPQTEMATHSNVARSLVAQTQILHFITTYLDGRTAEILDPYAELDID